MSVTSGLLSFFRLWIFFFSSGLLEWMDGCYPPSPLSTYLPRTNSAAEVAVEISVIFMHSLEVFACLTFLLYVRESEGVEGKIDWYTLLDWLCLFLCCFVSFGDMDVSGDCPGFFVFVVCLSVCIWTDYPYK